MKSGMQTSQAQQQLQSRMWQLLLGILLVSLPYIPRLPVAVLVMLALMTLWCIAIVIGKTSLPGAFVRFMLLALTIVTLIISFGTLLGRNAGTAFLVLLAFMKFFENKDRRDVFIIIFIGFFLLASNFFYTQEPWIAPYVFIVVVYLATLMILFADRLESTDFRQRLKIAGRMIVQAVPLMLVLFLLFPRIPGPLWGLPKDANTAVTGLSNDMSPGSISELIRSDQVAFRVRFKGAPPAHNNLYWRGPVFSHYDGKKWTADPASASTKPNMEYSSANESGLIEYAVTLEPHQRQWLFALEHPLPSNDQQYRLSRELQIFNRKKVTAAIRYNMISDPDAKNFSLFDEERVKNLQLPDNMNERTVALARQWTEERGGDHAAIAQRAMEFFNQQAFVYTLSPEPLGVDAMDDFLFKTQRGFCEHYTSAFVYLMRAAGIPARVVAGYQGGDMNPVDNYLIVRQSSAHAWAEIWLDDSGWVRYDPTAAVAPGRVEQGIQAAVSELDQLPAILVSNSRFLRTLRYRWDSFNAAWTEWVVGFDQNKQREFFTKLGFARADWQALASWLIGGMLLVGSIIAWWIFRQGRVRHIDRARLLYDIFCARLAKAGMPRKPSEGPGEFLQRIYRDLPTHGKAADRITKRYVRLRYGKDKSRRAMQEFNALVSAFSVK